MIGPQILRADSFRVGLFSVAATVPIRIWFWSDLKVGTELFGWRYENRSRHGFALALDAELRPSLGQCSNSNPCVIKNHASSVFDRAIARQPDGIACLVWDVKAEWRKWRPRFAATPSARLRANFWFAANRRRSGDPEAARARQLNRSQSGLHRSLGSWRRSVPKGPGESSPKRSAGK